MEIGIFGRSPLAVDSEDLSARSDWIGQIFAKHGASLQYITSAPTAATKLATISMQPVRR
jgi:hypothetical protein